MQQFPDPLIHTCTSHPLVERVRWQGLHDEWSLWSPCKTPTPPTSREGAASYGTQPNMGSEGQILETLV